MLENLEYLINIYNKERLVNERNDILKKLENTSSLTQEESNELVKRLNDVILKIAKVKKLVAD